MGSAERRVPLLLGAASNRCDPGNGGALPTRRGCGVVVRADATRAEASADRRPPYALLARPPRGGVVSSTPPIELGVESPSDNDDPASPPSSTLPETHQQWATAATKAIAATEAATAAPIAPALLARASFLDDPRLLERRGGTSTVGAAVGGAVSTTVAVGGAVGVSVVGANDGAARGTRVGTLEGRADGASLVGSADGAGVGSGDGAGVGSFDDVA